MKKVLVVLMFIAGGFSRSAAQSMLKVKVADGSPINIAVDGRYFNKRGTTVTVGDLPAGNHSLRIYGITYTRRGRPVEDVVYDGRVTTHDGNILFFSFDVSTQMTTINEEDINSYQNNVQPPVVDNGNNTAYNNTGGNGGNYDNGGNNTNAQQQPVNNDDNYTPPSSPVASPLSADQVGTLTDAKTDKLKTKADAKKTDTDKLTVLEDGLKKEKFTTSQVSYMMDWFSFESSKVEFAEWAYSNTVDKENFGELSSKLAYKNYQDDLNNFIKNKQ